MNTGASYFASLLSTSQTVTDQTTFQLVSLHVGEMTHSLPVVSKEMTNGDNVHEDKFHLSRAFSAALPTLSRVCPDLGKYLVPWVQILTPPRTSCVA